MKSGTSLVVEFRRYSVELARSTKRLVSSDLFGQKCYRAARDDYRRRGRNQGRRRAWYDLTILVDFVMDSLPFMDPHKHEEIGLLIHETWIKKQIEAIEKAIEEDPEAVPRLVRACLTSLRKVYARLDNGEVESLTELYDSFDPYPGIGLFKRS